MIYWSRIERVTHTINLFISGADLGFSIWGRLCQPLTQLLFGKNVKTKELGPLDPPLHLSI